MCLVRQASGIVHALNSLLCVCACVCVYVTHVCTQDWTGESVFEDAVLSTALKLPHVKFLVTTMGTRGSVCLQLRDSAEVRCGSACGQNAPVKLSAQRPAALWLQNAQRTESESGRICVSAAT